MQSYKKFILCEVNQCKVKLRLEPPLVPSQRYLVLSTEVLNSNSSAGKFAFMVWLPFHK